MIHQSQNLEIVYRYIRIDHVVTIYSSQIQHAVAETLPSCTLQLAKSTSKDIARTASQQRRITLRRANISQLHLQYTSMPITCINADDHFVCNRSIFAAKGCI